MARSQQLADFWHPTRDELAQLGVRSARQTSAYIRRSRHRPLAARRVRHPHRTVLRAVHTRVISRKTGQARPCRVRRTIELCGGNVAWSREYVRAIQYMTWNTPPGATSPRRRDASQSAPNTARASVVKFVEAATIACCHGSSALVEQRR
jgi:hypothetical protein